MAALYIGEIVVAQATENRASVDALCDAGMEAALELGERKAR
jgi:hypothetical protein